MDNPKQQTFYLLKNWIKLEKQITFERFLSIQVLLLKQIFQGTFQKMFTKKRNIVDENGKILFNPLKQIKTIPQGASTTVWCAVSPLLNDKGGVYCENNDITFVNDDSSRGFDEKGFAGVMSYAVSQEFADKLWIVSEQLTGVKL